VNKKEKVLELDKQEPKLSRADIAKQVPCSTAYVTQVLGAVRKYVKSKAPIGAA
jgi:hypothetical protein